MLKKVKGLIIASVITIASLGLVTSASAETTAGWVYIGGDEFPTSGDGGRTGGIVYSKGGDIRIVNDAFGQGTLKMYIYEDDETGNPSEFIDSRTLTGGYGRADLVDVERYVDGTNNRAEIYIYYSYDNVYGGVNSSIYD